MTSSAICSACGASAVTDGVCARCGNVSGAANRCPHCNVVARAEPKGSGASLTWVCGVCGGPRMPHGIGGEAALGPLREAKAQASFAARARASFWLFTMFAMLATLLAVAAWPAAIVGKLLVLALAVSPTVAAVRARARAARATARGAEALDRAWLAAAEDATSRAKRGVTVAELASRLKIDPAKAEKLLTQLAVQDRTRIDVDDEAEVRYIAGPELEPAVQMRIDATEEQFRALEEAELSEAEAKKLLVSPFPRGSGSRR